MGDNVAEFVRIPWRLHQPEDPSRWLRWLLAEFPLRGGLAEFSRILLRGESQRVHCSFLMGDNVAEFVRIPWRLHRPEDPSRSSYRGGARPGAVAQERAISPDWAHARGWRLRPFEPQTGAAWSREPDRENLAPESGGFSIGFTRDRRVTDPPWAPKRLSKCAPGKLFSGRKYQGDHNIG